MIPSIGLRIAARYLFSKKTHNAVNIISAVALCTTAIATAAMIIVLSVFNGFDDLARSKYSLLDPPVKVVSATSEFFDADSAAACLGEAGVDAMALPVAETKVFARGARGQVAATAIGVDPAFLDVAGLRRAMVSGACFVGDTLGAQWILAGAGVAVAMSERPGGALELLVPKRKGRLNPGSPLASFRADSVYMAGVFQVEDPLIDASTLLVPIATARQLSGIDDGMVSALYIYPRGAIDIGALDARLRAKGYRALDIVMQNGEAFRMIKIEKWITFALLAFILVIASFNIISTLTMLIIEKQGNMAVLRAMGCTRSAVKSVFAWEGALLSLGGGVAGCLLGVLLVEGQRLFGWVKLSGSVDESMLAINVYPVLLKATDFFVVLGLIAVLSLATTAIALSTFTPRGEVD